MSVWVGRSKYFRCLVSFRKHTLPSFLPTADYPLDYKEACFYAWYQAGRPVSRVLEIMPTAPDGRRPNIATINKWKEGGDGWEGWHEHADRLDAQLSLQLDKDAINRRAKVLKQLAEDGRKLKDKGLEHILKSPEPFKDNPSAAVRAIKDGSEMEFRYSGMAESLIQITHMDDKQLTKKVMQLLGKNENDDSVINIESTDSESPSEDADSNPQDDLD